MSNIQDLSKAFQKALEDKGLWDKPVAPEAGAPTGQQMVDQMLNGPDSNQIKFMLDMRISGGESVDDIAQQMIVDLGL